MRALIFDFNGVILDDEPVHLELFQRVVGGEGLALDAREYYAELVGYDDRDCFAAVFRRAGRSLGSGQLEALVARKAELYREVMHERGYPIFPGARELIAEAAGAGLPLAVVSGALREEVESGLEHAGVRRCFSVLVSADEVVEGKPDPEGYELALRLLNTTPPIPQPPLRPHEVAAIEDTPAGLAAARGAGLQCAGVGHTYPLSALADADVVVPRLAGLRLEDLRRRLLR